MNSLPRQHCCGAILALLGVNGKARPGQKNRRQPRAGLDTESSALLGSNPQACFY